MESNDQTEIARKIEANSESRLTAKGGGVGSEETEQKGKRACEHGQECGDFWDGEGV